MSAGRIEFPAGGDWGAYSQAALLRLAGLPEVGDLPQRLLFAAMGRHDSNLHAPFAVGELRALLVVVNKTTGELTAPRAQTIAGAISIAKDRGLLHQESNARCLVLHPSMFQKGRGRPRPCPHD